MVSSRGILVNSESISRLPMKHLLPWCTISSVKAKESVSVIEESLGTKNFQVCKLGGPILSAIGTLCYKKLGLEKILGYHIWHLRKLNQRRAQLATIS